MIELFSLKWLFQSQQCTSFNLFNILSVFPSSYDTSTHFHIKTPSNSTFEGDIGPAYARTVIGNSPGLFLSFKVLRALPENAPSVVTLSPEISGDHGPPIQDGVELSIVPNSGI